MASTASRFDPEAPNRDSTVNGRPGSGGAVAGLRPFARFPSRDSRGPLVPPGGVLPPAGAGLPAVRPLGPVSGGRIRGSGGLMGAGLNPGGPGSAPKGADLTYANEANPPLDSSGNPIDLLSLIGEAERVSQDYMAHTVEKALSRSYRAWQALHPASSKYLGTSYAGRSRLFVPKTRSAIEKNMAGAAMALFSTDDVVNISAEFEDDPIQRAVAATVKGCLDYRLTRTSPRTGIPWFRIAMGACVDGQVTGVAVSKQSWKHEEVEVPGEYETALVAMVDEETGGLIDESGAPLPEDAEPIMVEGLVPKKRVVCDRPDIQLFPIENAGIDPAAPWYEPAQLGRWFFMRHPMGLSDARAWLRNGAAQGMIEVADALLLKGRVDDERQGARRSREAGSDRYEDGKARGDLDIVWVQENFLRIDGIDWHFWSVGRHGYLSVIRQTRDAYPALEGERPYVFGIAQIDPHRVFPQSPVESWRPLQQEMNDIANLRLDGLKRAIAGFPVVKRGRNVDILSLQRRGQPEAYMMADEPATDIKFLETPAPPGQSFTESSILNASFDETAGVFSTSSVQTSRQLNETVGGMRLMAGSANAVGEFKLRVWIETWAEPAIRQLVQLERYYESDSKVVQIAGAKARVMQRFGLQEAFGPDFVPPFLRPAGIPAQLGGLDLSDFETTDLWVRVNVGIGSADPMQSLAKLKMAFEMMAPLFQIAMAQGVQPDIEAIVEEVMGKAGFRDGRRFFKWGQQPVNPEGEGAGGAADLAKIKAQMEIEREKLMLEAQRMRQDFQQFMIELRAEMADSAAERRLKLELEQMKGRRDVVRDVAKHAVGAQQARDGRQHEAAMSREGRAHEVQQTREGREHEAGMAREGRAHESSEARTARAHDAEQAREGRDHEARQAAAKAAGEGGKGRGRDARSSSKSHGGPRLSAGQSGAPDAAARERVIDILTGGAAKPGGAAGTRAAALPQPAAMERAASGRGGGGDRNLMAMQRMMDGLVQSNTANARALEAIAAHIAAPAQVVYDPDTGRPVGVRKGASMQHIVRSPDQRVLGTRQIGAA